MYGIPDDDPDRLRLWVSPSASGLRGQEVIGAAERAGGLYLLASQGTVHGYDEGSSGREEWQTIDLGGQGGGTPPVGQWRRILFPTPDHMVVVGPKNVLIYERGNEQWRLLRSLVSGATICDAWDSGSGRVLAGITDKQSDAQAGCYSSVFTASVSGGTGRTLFLGPGVTGSVNTPGQSVAVAERSIGNDVWLFGAGSDGELWAYSMGGRHWVRQTPTQVEEFRLGVGGLWAYAPQRMSLYQLIEANPPRWQTYRTEGLVADFVVDEKSGLVRLVSGHLQLVSGGQSGRATGADFPANNFVPSRARCGSC